MGTLQGELIRQGLAQEQDYIDELKLQDIHPDLRPLLRKMKELKDKFPLLTDAERLWIISFKLGLTLDARVEAAEHICRALEKH